MTRIKLKQIGNTKRNRYRAKVGRLGIKNNVFKGFPERTILLLNIIDCATGEVVTDHIWLTCGVVLKRLNIKSGDTVEFDARVGKYKKGYYHNKKDYTLKRPTKYTVIPDERELEKNEITSATAPSFKELEEARRNAQIEKGYYEYDLPPDLDPY